MADGFMLNSGVPQGAGRINPEGVAPSGTPALSVPNNVPLVAPANNTTKYEPNNGALELAQALGNINFGAIGRAVNARNEAKRKLREESDQAAGMAEYAKLSSELGTDYETLVKSGRIPVSASPAFRLGFDIKAAQVEFDRFRDEMTKRGIDDPSSVPFTSDPKLMQPYLQRLNGMRNEAVVKYFLEPIETLGADDNKRYAKWYDTEAQNKLRNNALESFQRAIERGDPIGAAASNGLNIYALSHQLTDDNVKDFITVAGPSIMRRARDPVTGRISLSMAGKLIDEFSQTKLSEKGFGGRAIETQFPSELASLRSYVYGGVVEASKAENEQYTAQQNSAKMAFTNYLTDPKVSPRNPDGSLKLPSVTEAIAKARSLGLDPADVPTIYKSWDGVGGNVSAADAYADEFRAKAIAVLSTKTPDERKRYFESLPAQLETGALTNKEFLVLDSLRKTYERTDVKSAMSAGDRKRVETTLRDRLSTLWDGNGYLNMLHGSRYKNVSMDQVPNKIAGRLTGLAVTWAEGSPLWNEYRTAQTNIANDPEGPGRVLDRIVDSFLVSNRDVLRNGVTRAVVSDDPDGNLQKIRLTSGASEPNPRTAQQSAPKRTTPKPLKPTAHDPVQTVRTTAKAVSNITTPGSGIYKWYASHVRSKRPGTTDAEIMTRIRSLSPSTIRLLQQRFDYENEGGTR